jgi:phosphoenolpyruvate-protein kinase (PTS system EI component)
MLRRVSCEDAAKVAEQALRMDTAKEVEDLVKSHVDQYLDT